MRLRATLIQGLEWPDGAYRKLDWGSRCEKNLDPKRALKEFGIEHQLQLARPFRLGLATIQFEATGLLVLRIGIEVEIVLRGCSSGRLRWRAGAGPGSQRAFPQTAVAEDPLDQGFLIRSGNPPCLCNMERKPVRREETP